MRQLTTIAVGLALLSTAAAAQDESPTEPADRISLLRSVVDLHEVKLDRLRALAKKGAVSETAQRKAEQDLARARLELAQAAKDTNEVVRLRETVVRLRQLELDRLTQLQALGAVSESSHLQAAIALKSAQAELAAARESQPIKPPQPEAPQTDDALRKLLENRLDILRQQVEVDTIGFQTGQQTIERVVKSTSRLLEAEAELEPDARKRIALYEKRVELMKQLEEHAGRRFKVGTTPVSEKLAAQVARLDAEIALHRFRRRVETNEQSQPQRR